MGRVGSTTLYVEKKTCEFAVQADRIAGFPVTIGAGFAEIGFIFESFTSSFSILRCSCGWGRLVRIITQFSHALGQRRRTQTVARSSAVEILKHFANNCEVGIGRRCGHHIVPGGFKIIGPVNHCCHPPPSARYSIAISLPCLCEFVWGLRRVYNFGQQDISRALRALLNASNVAVDRPAADAGLVVLNAGGDFADGLIAYEGNWLGGGSFVSFDKKAVSLVVKQGQHAKLLT